MVSFAHFLRFKCTLFLHLNQDQLVISGHETKIFTGNCTVDKNEASDVFIDGSFRVNVVQSSFFKCAKYMDYAIIDKLWYFIQFSYRNSQYNRQNSGVFFYAFSAYLHVLSLLSTKFLDSTRI